MITSAANGGRGTRRRAVAEVVQGIHAIFRGVDTFSKRTFKTFGLTGPQIWALREVSQRGDLRVTDLAKAMYLHISTVTGIIDRLEEAGMLVRGYRKPDRRVVHLRLTPRGRDVLKRAPVPPRCKMADRVSRLKGADLHRLRWAVDRLSHLMDISPQEGETPPK